MTLTLLVRAGVARRRRGAPARRARRASTGDRIAAVEAGVDAAAGDASGWPASPCPGSPTPTATPSTERCAGRTHGGAGSFWTWREQMYALAGRLDPDAYYALARATFAEMALAGFTCVGEFHYLHHGPAASRTPTRTRWARDRRPPPPRPASGSRCSTRATSHGGSAALSRRERRRRGPTRGRRSSRRRRRVAHRRRDPLGARGRPGGDRGGRGVGRRARRAAARPRDRAAGRERAVPADAYGVHARPSCSAEHGALSERFTAVHATHVTDDDIALLGAAGATCCFCPTTERDLADGIGPAARAGRRRRAAVPRHRLARGRSTRSRRRGRSSSTSAWPSRRARAPTAPRELLAAATGDGYRSLGGPRAGGSRRARSPTSTTVALDSVRLAGADRRARRGVVFAATPPTSPRDGRRAGRARRRARAHRRRRASCASIGRLGP